MMTCLLLAGFMSQYGQELGTWVTGNFRGRADLFDAFLLFEDSLSGCSLERE